MEMNTAERSRAILQRLRIICFSLCNSPSLQRKIKEERYTGQSGGMEKPLQLPYNHAVSSKMEFQVRGGVSWATDLSIS